MFNTFPFNLRFRASGFHVVGASSEPRQSVGGAFSVQPRLGAHWVGAISFLITNDETTLALQAFVAGMEGMLGTTSVPVYQKYLMRDGLGQVSCSGISALGNDLQYEHDGSQSAEFWGFENGSAMSGEIATAADLRASEVTVARTNYSDFRPGQDFSIGGRLHRAVNIWPDGANDRVRITPPLRAGVDVGETVVMDAPCCLMRFASESEGQQVYGLKTVREVTLNFVEAI